MWCAILRPLDQGDFPVSRCVELPDQISRDMNGIRRTVQSLTKCNMCPDIAAIIHRNHLGD